MVTIKATKENCTPAQKTFKITVKPADVAAKPLSIKVNDAATDKAFAVPYVEGGTIGCKLDMSMMSEGRNVSSEYNITYSLTNNGTNSEAFTLTDADTIFTKDAEGYN